MRASKPNLWLFFMIETSHRGCGTLVPIGIHENLLSDSGRYTSPIIYGPISSLVNTHKAEYRNSSPTKHSHLFMSAMAVLANQQLRVSFTGSSGVLAEWRMPRHASMTPALLFLVAQVALTRASERERWKPKLDKAIETTIKEARSRSSKN